MSFRFATPLAFALLLLIPFLATLPYWSARHRKPATLRYADTRLVSGASSWRLRLRWLPPTLRWLALTLLIFGLARPQTGESRQVVTGEGVDIALALDISGSMAALDFVPENRLVAAKGVIESFIGERPFDRIGLVIFARRAFVQSPLTVDHTVLGRLLEQIELAPTLGVEDGTAVGLGLANAANMLKDSQAVSKVVILLTDGVNNSGQIDPLTAAEAAKSLGIRVYTIGMGQPGRVPVPMRNSLGQLQTVYRESQLDEATLQQIAEETGGLYFRAEDTRGLSQIYEEINALEQSDIEVEVYNQFTEWAAWLIVPAVLLLLLEMLLRQTVLRTVP